MYRVLRILNRFNLGGPIYNASYLSADLFPEFETRLIGGAPEPGEAEALYIPESLGVAPQIIGSFQRAIHPFNDRKAFREVRAIIREWKPHIVHTHAAKAGAIGRLAAFAENVPVTVHTFHGHVFHSYFGAAKTAFYKGVERHLAQRTSAVVAISELQKHELCQVHRVAPEDRTHVIPLGFDLTPFQTDHAAKRRAFREDLNLDSNDFVYGIIGRLTAIKNHRLFLDAFAKVKAASSRPVKAIIIGDGELRESLEAYAGELGLTSARCRPRSEAQGAQGELPLTPYDVCFTSWITAIHEVLPGLDTAVLSSRNEGTPVSMIEAQAAAVPVISTDVGGVRDVIAHRATGLVVAPGNTEDLANAMKEMCENQALYNEMQRAAPRHVLERFSRERLAQDMRRLYLNLL